MRLTDVSVLAEARRLLAVDPVRAASFARKVLATTPGSVEARFLLGAASRRAGDLAAAIDALGASVKCRPAAWGTNFELGMALAAGGHVAAALPWLREAATRNPASSLVLHALGDTLVLVGRADEADDLWRRPVPGGLADARLHAATPALFERGDPAPLAELGLHLCDPAAVCLIAAAGLQASHHEAVRLLLEQTLAVTPDHLSSRLALASALYRLDRGEAALVAINRVAAVAPAPVVRALRGSIQMQLGAVAAAIEDYEAIVSDDATVWHSYGHALRAAGRQDDAIAAYRRALALRPDFAEVYWSLANLKTWRFSRDDHAAMAALSVTAGDVERAFLQFALGKAMDDEGDAARAFGHYAAGNAARRSTGGYDRAAQEDFVARTIATFTSSFIAGHAGSGDPSPDPIFVVGLPRSGSTLIEQILGSHSQVDGLSELPDLPTIASGLGGRYPDVLAGLDAPALKRVGRDYLERTRSRRTAGRTRFVDKYPGNFLHSGLIRLALPNAAIVDVRRDPVATCFSLYKQLFARGQAYSYDLADLGHCYRSYITLMDHFETVLPGHVVRLSYEAVVDDTEGETRRLLARLGLAFEPACLRFFASTRAVRTASSEQVRRPVYRTAIDEWRQHEDRLGRLLEALGPLAPPQLPRQ